MSDDDDSTSSQGDMEDIEDLQDDNDLAFERVLQNMDKFFAKQDFNSQSNLFTNKQNIVTTWLKNASFEQSAMLQGVLTNLGDMLEIAMGSSSSTTATSQSNNATTAASADQQQQQQPVSSTAQASPAATATTAGEAATSSTQATGVVQVPLADSANNNTSAAAAALDERRKQSISFKSISALSTQELNQILFVYNGLSTFVTNLIENKYEIPFYFCFSILLNF